LCRREKEREGKKTRIVGKRERESKIEKERGEEREKQGACTREVWLGRQESKRAREQESKRD